MNRTSPSQFTLPLLAVEMQYFRLPSYQWELMLARACQMKANTISTCVPWGWHEYQEDLYDFNGESAPGRNLIGFIRLASELDLKIVLRPGPFVDSALLGGGIPTWLLARSPQMLATRMDGSLYRHTASDQPRASYLHPQFLENVRIWYQKFSEVMLPHQWPLGPVIALQVDHETPGDGMLSLDIDEPGFDQRFRGDFNPHVFNELWPKWLEKRFQSVEILNRAYESSYQNFEAVPYPSRWRAPKKVAELRYWQDISRFYDWIFNQTLTSYAGILRQAGWNVPLFHNLTDLPWQVGGLSVDIPGYASAVGWLSSSLIPHKYQESQTPNHKDKGTVTASRNNQTSLEEYFHAVSWRTRLLKNYTPHLPSLVSHISSASDFNLHAAFASGLEAASIFPTVQSDPEPVEIGGFTKWVMDAPIRKDGSVKRTFWNASALFAYLAAGGEIIARSHTPADIAVGYSHIPELTAAWCSARWDESATSNRLSDLPDAVRGCNMARESQVLASRLARAGMQYAVIDVDISTGQLERYPLLVMPATPILARLTQERLLKYLSSGKTILWIGGNFPSLDENLQSCELLANAGMDQPNLVRITDSSSDWPGKMKADGRQSAWAWNKSMLPGQDLILNLRYGTHETIFLGIVNPHSQIVRGEVTYLDPKQAEKGLKIRLGGPHASFVTLRGEVIEAALLHCGEGSPASGRPGEDLQSASIESGQSSILVDHGQAVMAAFGKAVFISASETTSLTLTRPGGWENLRGWRLLLDGGIEPTAFYTKGNRLFLPYPIEVNGLETEAVVLIPANAAIDARLWPWFSSRIMNAALCTEKGCEVSQKVIQSIATSKFSAVRNNNTMLSMAINQLRTLSEQLRAFARSPQSMENFTQKWHIAASKMSVPNNAFAEALRRMRSEMTLHPHNSELSEIENVLCTSLNILEDAHLV